MRIVNITLITFLILLASDIQAQKKKNPFSSANTRAISARAGLWVNVGLGPRILKAVPGTITTSFTDDSPFSNSFESTLDIKDSYTQVAMQPAIGFTHPSGLSHTIFGDVTFSKNFVLLYGYSLGWDIPFGTGSTRFIIRPAANAALGKIRFPLGKFEHSSEYIEIENDIHNSDFLRVRLVQRIATYGPQLDFTCLFPSNMGITLSVAYDFAQNINMPNIRFTTPLEIDARNGDNLIYKTVIKLDHEHLNIGYNDSTINRLPHEYGGFRITLSLMEF